MARMRIEATRRANAVPPPSNPNQYVLMYELMSDFMLHSIVELGCPFLADVRFKRARDFLVMTDTGSYLHSQSKIP